MLRFACPHCGTNLKAPAGAAGRTIRCPRCRNAMEVPFVFQGEEPPVRSSRPQRAAESLSDALYRPLAFSTPEWESPARPSKTGPFAVSFAIVAGLFLLLFVFVVSKSKGPDPSPVAQVTIGKQPQFAPLPLPPVSPQPVLQVREPERMPRNEDEEPEPEIRLRVPQPLKDIAADDLVDQRKEARVLGPGVRPPKFLDPPREGGEAKPKKGKVEDAPLEVTELPAKNYESACGAARTKLLQAFEAAIDVLAKGNDPVDEKLKRMDTLRREKERFEIGGLIPWSEPMRPHVDPYLLSLGKAQINLNDSYKSVIDKEVRARNDKEVDRLRLEWKKRLDVKVMAQWRRIGNGPGVVHTLYSNGKINDSEGDAKWNYDNGVLIFRWPAPNVPGGIWIERLEIAVDGTKYTGNNLNKPEKNPNLTGVYVLDVLRHSIVVGKPAPEIEAEDIDGTKFKLSDYRGKVVLLDFWGNW